MAARSGRRTGASYGSDEDRKPAELPGRAEPFDHREVLDIQRYERRSFLLRRCSGQVVGSEVTGDYQP
jgi:hypothetical protein